MDRNKLIDINNKVSSNTRLPISVSCGLDTLDTITSEIESCSYTIGYTDNWYMIIKPTEVLLTDDLLLNLIHHAINYIIEKRIMLLETNVIYKLK